VGPRAGLDRYGKSRLHTGIRSPDRPACSSVAIQTELPGPHVDINVSEKITTLIFGVKISHAGKVRGCIGDRRTNLPSAMRK